MLTLTLLLLLLVKHETITKTNKLYRSSLKGCDSQLESIKIHHGRKFGFDGEPLHYVGCETLIVNYCDEDRWSRSEAMEIVVEQGYVAENIVAMWYKSPKDETDVRLRMLHTDKDAMDMARIGMRDNMVELFVIHKDGATTRKGCTIEKVEDIDGSEAAAPTAETIGPGPIVVHKAQSFAQAKVGKKPKVVTEAQNHMLEDDDEERSERSDFSGDDESKDDDYQPRNDDEGDSDEQWSENSSGDSDLEVAFDDSNDDWNGDGGLYDVEVTTTKDFQKMKQSVQIERVQGEFSGSVNKGKEQVVAAGLRDADDGLRVRSCGMSLKICENPKIKLRTLIKKAHSKWNVDLTKTKASRVKQQALDEINGTYGEQYRRIHDYAAELLRSNPGSTVQIQVERPPEFKLETPIPGKDMRPRFERIYKAAKATYVQEWERRMKEIQLVDQGAYNHLMEIPAKYWNKSMFNHFPRVDTLVNNICRDKYEVSTSQCNRDKFVVDLNLHECSCRKFKLTGYPCEHAMSCIRKMCLDVKNYVNKCCRKETYVDCNQHVIYPVNRPNLWTQTENDDVLSLVFRKPIERPKLKLHKPRKVLAQLGLQIPAKTTTKPATKLQPKKKSNTQVGGSQESQTSSKRARCSSIASQPQPSTATVTSPSRRTLKFMAKTPPRAWKALG
ncbi:hypothetical protein Ahy_A07g036411 [Arachis hypogaea]|uniref:SWIM-type domain-containing protein n=1 Tax=Arachis hypogaea TaxID=3818 RepID=A0A445CG33_ARAHY|nr:hypothetical protein Ahy_A07g036411 [Arachis hypogaea]